MASSPPLANELHKVVIQLPGSQLHKDVKRKLAAYRKYMKEVRKLAKRFGARVVSKEIHLSQGAITRRKKDLNKKARRGSK
jgi:N-methylhydantoinase B/oxoprolinase/acetone carboxylase alpha subunit